MEVIEENKNMVITSCMHKFHAECLFMNICANGYKCPNCRGVLISNAPATESTWYIDRVGDVTPHSHISIDTSSGMYSDTDIDDDSE